MMLKVSYDPSADLKRLRKLEIQGHIEIYAVAIETIPETRKVKRKELPMAVIGSPLALIDQCVIGNNENTYTEIQQIIGRAHHCDILHFERHVNDKRDIFATDDTDFLNVRDELMQRFDTKIMTVTELENLLRV